MKEYAIELISKGSVIIPQCEVAMFRIYCLGRIIIHGGADLGDDGQVFYIESACSRV